MSSFFATKLDNCCNRILGPIVPAGRAAWRHAVAAAAVVYGIRVVAGIPIADFWNLVEAD